MIIILVEESVPSEAASNPSIQGPPPPDVERESRTVFVSNLSYDLTEDQIIQVLSKVRGLKHSICYLASSFNYFFVEDTFSSKYGVTILMLNR